MTGEADDRNVVEAEVGVGVEEEDDRDVELLVQLVLEPAAIGAGVGATTVAVTSAVTVDPGFGIWTVFVASSTIVVASAGALVDAPPSTLMTE